MARDESARIAVVGAGIAGLTFAAALRRAGRDCLVYEQAARLGEVGAGVQLSPNAVRLLYRAGLRAHLDRVAVRPSAIEMRRWDTGEVVSQTPLGDECEERYGAPYLTVHRADLHRGLLDLVAPEVIRINRRASGLTTQDDRVELRFDDGTVTRSELVVGADGVRSVVRAAVVEDRPRFSGQSVYRMLVPAERVPELAWEPTVRLWLGPDRHCVSYPVSAGRLVNVVATAPDPDWRVESWSAPGRVADALAGYQGWHRQVRRLLAAADATTRWAVHDRDTVVHRGGPRVALIGDAAHPMLPFAAQGANQAIEDAVVLAACLDESDGADVPGSLRRYERLRSARTTQVHQRSRDNTAVLHRADPDRAPGDLSTYDWLYGYDALAGVAAPTATAWSGAARRRER